MCRKMQEMSALDLKWLTRIILRKMKLNMGSERILSAYHPDAATAIKQSSLRDVCTNIENGNAMDTVRPFQQLNAMLCEKLVLRRLKNMLAADEYYLETKMDGERCQMHMEGNEYRYYSRNGMDFSDRYGRNTCSGNFTPILARLLGSHIQNIILDGEMMVWNREVQAFQCHGNAKHTHKNGIIKKYCSNRPIFCIHCRRFCKCPRFVGYRCR